MYQQVNNVAHFEKGKAFFLTYKGDGKHQLMDTVVKRLKKVSNTFLVIREKNKIAMGYHYHALFKLKSDMKNISKRWFRKGVHMHLVDLQESKSTLASFDYGDWKKDKLKNDTSMNENEIAKLKLQIEMSKLYKKKYKLEKRSKKQSTIEKILKYMSKEAQNPLQYTDYVFIYRKKSLPIYTQ